MPSKAVKPLLAAWAAAGTGVTTRMCIAHNCVVRSGITCARQTYQYSAKSANTHVHENSQEALKGSCYFSVISD